MDMIRCAQETRGDSLSFRKLESFDRAKSKNDQNTSDFAHVVWTSACVKSGNKSIKNFSVATVAVVPGSQDPRILARNSMILDLGFSFRILPQ